MKTGDSRNDVGLNPGGIVMLVVDLEIGSIAGDMSLYLAPPPPPPPAELCLAVGSTVAEQSTWSSSRSLLAWGRSISGENLERGGESARRKREAQLWRRIESFCSLSFLLCVSEDVVRKILTSDTSLRLFILFLFLTSFILVNQISSFFLLSKGTNNECYIVSKKNRLNTVYSGIKRTETNFTFL